MNALTAYALGGTMIPNAVLAITTEQREVLRLERELGKMPQVELPLEHFFIETPDGKGYARQLTIFKDVALVGRVHKHPCINIISKGDISVTTDHGVKRLQAPCTFVSPAGFKRAGYAHEETIWTTFHVANETDVDKIEDYLGTVTYEEFLEYTKCLLLP